MGAFDNVQFAKYRPTYVGLPVEQFIKTASALNDRYEQSIEGYDKVQSMMANTPAHETKQAQLQEIGNNINNDLKTYVQNGNWEDAPLAIRETAQKNITNNKIYHGIVSDYQNRQAQLKDLDEGVKKGVANGGYSKQYADSIAKMAFDLIGNEPIKVDEKGNVTGVFKPITPPREVDVIAEPLKIAKEIVESTSISSLQKYPGLNGYLYQDTFEGKDPEKILQAVNSWFKNNPDAKSYLDFKTKMDYHNSHYDTDSKTYIKPTIDELNKLGYVVMETSYQGSDSDGNMIELQPGDITVRLPKVPILDSKGKETGKFKETFSDAFANIQDNNLEAIWKAGYHNSLTQSPTATIVSMLSGMKQDRKIIKDENYWVWEDRNYTAKEAAKLVNDAYGVIIPSNVPNSVYKSYSDYKAQKDVIMNDLPTIMTKALSSYDDKNIPASERRLLQAFLTSKTKYAADINKLKWTNPIAVAELVQLREQQFGKADYMDMINDKAMKAAGINNEVDLDNIFNQYRQEAINSIEKANTMSKSNVSSTFGNVNNDVTIPLNDETILREMKRIAFSKDSRLGKYQDFIETTSKQAGTINATNIFGMSKAETDMLNADLLKLVEQNITKGGMANVFNASTLVQVKDKKRGTYQAKIDPGTMLIDVVKGKPGISIMVRPFIDNKGTLGDYVLMSGINGLDAVLAKHPGTAKLMQYKQTLNLTTDEPGKLIPIQGTDFFIRKNLPIVDNNGNTLDDATGFTFTGPTLVNGKYEIKDSTPIYNIDDIVKGLDTMYN